MLRVLDFGLITEPRLRAFDLEERIWPRPSGPERVAVVEIDEKSLAQYGQWPWPRSLVARLVRRIAEGQPRVLGVDIVFAEHDRLSPPEIARGLPGLPLPVVEALKRFPPSERELADAISEIPSVLALVPGREDTSPLPGPMHPAPIRQAGGDATPFLLSYKSLLSSLPELGAAARSAGAIAEEADDDGIVRRVAIAVSYAGTIIPCFALEVLRVGGAERSVVIDTGSFGIKGVRVGDLYIPTDWRGRAIIRFAPRLARFISAADVLDPAFDPAELRSQIVLLGVAGLGIARPPETPLGLVEHIDIHAQLIESLLLGEFLQRPAYMEWIELALALAAAFAAIWLLRYDRPLRAAAIAGAIVVCFIGLEAASFRFADLLFDSTYPAAATLAAFGVMLVGNLRAAEAELGREREAKQRIEGELAAAQAIQMGLLPHRFPAFPDRPELDVYAYIAPARIVGGDLYDYLLIDRDHRLFFLIADVSGKGAAAALLMASTKEITREAVLKSGTALDRIFAEANRKIAIASSDLESEGGVFVTAFAGMLDPATGDITYASAGHDSPFILGSGNRLRQLETVGGPPLGAVDDFLYPIDHDRIGPGEVLLLYTDGVTEAENSGRMLYTRQRLAAALATAPAVSARSVVNAVIEDLRSFMGNAEQADDITLLALRLAAEELPGFGRPVI